jgi:hypothetical protein
MKSFLQSSLLSFMKTSTLTHLARVLSTCIWRWRQYVRSKRRKPLQLVPASELRRHTKEYNLFILRNALIIFISYGNNYSMKHKRVSASGWQLVVWGPTWHTRLPTVAWGKICINEISGVMTMLYSLFCVTQHFMTYWRRKYAMAVQGTSWREGRGG